MMDQRIEEPRLRTFGEAVFRAAGYTAEQSADIVDVLLTADLYGIESHGVQRLIRYYQAMREGSIRPDASYRIIHETPLSAVIDAPRTMGQLMGKFGMRLAMDKARQVGIGMVVIRRTNHYGIAGYYASMAAAQDMIGISMANTEAIMIPTHGRQAMLGTNPIALCMPADPVPFWFDAATTVVTRGKLEVYDKRGEALPHGWAADEHGQDCTDAGRVIGNIIAKLGGGILPLGGLDEQTGSHKGYGLAMVVEILTAIVSGGTTGPHVQRSGNSDTTFTMWAIDYGIFGNKVEIRDRMSTLLQELRDSPRAAGRDRIYIHGEKERESRQRMLREGIPVQAATLAELRMIGDELGVPRI